MNNILKINKIAAVSEAADIPSAFAAAKVPYNVLGTLNWPETYPYKPQVSFALAHCSDAILLHYKVSEQSVLAHCSFDRESIWQDSCVEFFLSPEPGDGLYYNFEFNCIGRMYACVGPDRNKRNFLPDSAFCAVQRYATLGGNPFEQRKGGYDWELSVVIPVRCLTAHDIKKLDGRRMKGNFYKCGDHLSVPHFVSFAPIGVPKPDFHRPEFFCTLEFE